MAPDAMNQQFGEYSAAEIARHVGDHRTTTTSPSRSWHVARMSRRAISRLTSGLMSRLRTHADPRTVEPAPPHAMPVSH